MGLADRVAQLESRVGNLESRVSAVEAGISAQLDGLGGYKSKTREELDEVKHQLVAIIAILDSMIAAAEIQSDVERAAALRRRARNNHTRVTRAALVLDQ